MVRLWLPLFCSILWSAAAATASINSVVVRRATEVPIPTRLELTRAGENDCCFNLSWHRGNGVYSQPVQYQIWGRVLDDDDPHDPFQVLPGVNISGQWQMITGLERGKVYEFKVASSGPDQVSSRSAASERLAFGPAAQSVQTPPAPKTESNSGEVVVRWLGPSRADSFCHPTSYELEASRWSLQSRLGVEKLAVEYNTEMVFSQPIQDTEGTNNAPDSQSAWQQRHLPPSDLPAGIWKFRVRAVCMEQRGSWSAHSEMPVSVAGAILRNKNGTLVGVGDHVFLSPAQVKGCNASIVNSSHILVDWPSLPRFNATSYVVLAEPVDGHVERRAVTLRLQARESSTGTQAAVIPTLNFKPGASYFFQVVGINVNTHGSPSTRSNPVEIPGLSAVNQSNVNWEGPIQPPARVRGVTSELTRNGRVLVAWIPLNSFHQDPEQVGLEYVLYSLRNRSGLRQVVDSHIPYRNHNYTVPRNRLVAGESYMFRVAAVMGSHTSSAMHGPMSHQSSALSVPESAGSAVLPSPSPPGVVVPKGLEVAPDASLVSNGHDVIVRVDWSNALSVDGWWESASHVTGFLVACHQVDAAAHPCSGLVRPSHSRYDLRTEQLSPGNYTFQIKTAAADGSFSDLSPPSQPVQIHPNHTVPQKQGSVTDRTVSGVVVVYSAAQVNLFWHPSVASTDRYLVEYCHVDANLHWTTVPGASQLLLPTLELVPDPAWLASRGRYFFRVRLVDPTTGEMGAASEPVEAIPGAGLPSQPGHVLALEHQSHNLTIGWAEPMDAGGLPLLEYRVQIFPTEGEPAFFVVDPQHDELLLNETVLDPGKTYSFQVSARNAMGWGHPSLAVKPMRFKLMTSIQQDDEDQGQPNIFIGGVLGMVGAISFMVGLVFLCLKRDRSDTGYMEAKMSSADTVFDKRAADPDDMF